jgi:hypothetical protein
MLRRSPHEPLPTWVASVERSQAGKDDSSKPVKVSYRAASGK